MRAEHSVAWREASACCARLRSTCGGGMGVCVCVCWGVPPAGWWEGGGACVGRAAAAGWGGGAKVPGVHVAERGPGGKVTRPEGRREGKGGWGQAEAGKRPRNHHLLQQRRNLALEILLLFPPMRPLRHRRPRLGRKQNGEGGRAGRLSGGKYILGGNDGVSDQDHDYTSRSQSRSPAPSASQKHLEAPSTAPPPCPRATTWGVTHKGKGVIPAPPQARGVQYVIPAPSSPA
eukprot:scaffold10684_cov83-Isochrysis_galbana.AAC.2